MTNLAADKSLQLCPTLCDPIDSSPPGSSIPGILQARTLEWVAISFSKACMHAKLLQSRPTLCNPMDSTPPDSSVRGILPARILDWVAISFSNDKLRQHIKKQRHYFANKGPSSQSYGFSSSHVGMWELDHKEGWVLKNWCFWTVVLEKALASPLDCEEIKQVNPKGNQLWIFIGRTDAEAEAPILWLPDMKSQLVGKDSWFWERLSTGGEGGNRGWVSWMASLTQWTGVWTNSGK